LNTIIIEEATKHSQENIFVIILFSMKILSYIKDAIAREKEIKGWRREKKLNIIKAFNPSWTFLNAALCEGWPPKENITRN